MVWPLLLSFSLYSIKKSKNFFFLTIIVIIIFCSSFAYFFFSLKISHSEQLFSPLAFFDLQSCSRQTNQTRVSGFSAFSVFLLSFAFAWPAFIGLILTFFLFFFLLKTIEISFMISGCVLFESCVFGRFILIFLY